MKYKLIIFSFTLFFFFFFFNSVQSICIPRNSSTPSPSPDTPPNLKPVSSSPKAPTPSSSPRKDPAPSSPAPKASTTVSVPPQSASSPDSNSLVKRPKLNSVAPALPKQGGGKDNPAIHKICESTDFPEVCLTTLGPYSGRANDVSAVLGLAIKAGSDYSKTAQDTATKLSRKPGMPPAEAEASPYKDCKDNYDDVSYNFQRAAEALPKKDVGTMNTMLSAAITDVSDCEDAFDGQNSPLTTSSLTLRKMASNCLAIVAQMPK